MKIIFRGSKKINLFVLLYAHNLMNCVSYWFHIYILTLKAEIFISQATVIIFAWITWVENIIDKILLKTMGESIPYLIGNISTVHLKRSKIEVWSNCPSSYKSVARVILPCIIYLHKDFHTGEREAQRSVLLMLH